MIRVPEQRRHDNLLATCTVFPWSNAAATNFFLLLKLAAITQGRQLLEGGNKNYYCIYDNMNNENFLFQVQAAALFIVFLASSTTASLNAASQDLFWFADRHGPIAYSTYSSAAHNKQVDTA